MSNHYVLVKEEASTSCLFPLSYCRYAGAQQMAEGRVVTFEEAASTVAEQSTASRRMSVAQASKEAVPATPLVVCLGQGLPPIPKWTVDRIKAGEYIDFTKLPLARSNVPGAGRAGDCGAGSRPPAVSLQSGYFAIFVAVVAGHQPARVPDIMGYSSLIARLSRKFRWPSWVVYNQNFCHEGAGSPEQQWAKVDPSLFAQCFTGQEACSENWCGEVPGPRPHHSELSIPV